jgi:hypothetical protein
MLEAVTWRLADRGMHAYNGVFVYVPELLSLNVWHMVMGSTDSVFVDTPMTVHAESDGDSQYQVVGDNSTVRPSLELSMIASTILNPSLLSSAFTTTSASPFNALANPR